MFFSLNFTILGQVPFMNKCNFEELGDSNTLKTVLDCEIIAKILNENEEVSKSGLKIMPSTDPGR